VDWIRSEDPFEFESFRALLKEADEYTRREDGGIAVVISRRPCLVNDKAMRKGFTTPVAVDAECNGCKVCIKRFECPGIRFDDDKERAEIDPLWCIDCGFCLHVCPTGNIIEVK
jgi:indolepyruvate ferredoxin oxidoreductase alpha subunit